MTTGATERLAERLAPVGGLELRAEAPLARCSTFRIGGPAELLVEASSERSLARLVVSAGELGLPLHLLGLGSNVLFPDAGLKGVVVRLVGELRRVRIRGHRVSAGAGAALGQVARKCARAGLAGLEALSGFPSTVGGAVYMNAGSYGTEMKDVVHSVRLVAADGSRRRLPVSALAPVYRATNLRGSGAIVTRALFELAEGDAAALVARIEELNSKRWAALPSGLPNVGSIFRNPPGDHAGRLIEACGLKGAAIGGAQISPKHANVIVNAGGATASEVLALMRRARDEVAARFGVELQPEVVLAGELEAEWRGTRRG
ncbi:MAG: UDP-N-acetylmuramate dehydrogenase [Acidobacteria bacterium]|nr:UDP-N-acetylmuramate dehydrogenase [Acidobacteriota bacterium]